MVSDIYYGLIKEDRLDSWESNKDPYDILENKIRINVGGWNFLFKDEILRERTQVDWGSFAYKATYEELVQLGKALKCEIPELHKFNKDTEFGVVIIEGV